SGHPYRARRLRPALGGEGRGLLVPHVDDVDALLATAVVDREEVAAGQGEELRDAGGAEPLGDEPTAVGLLPLGLGGHRQAGYRATPARTWAPAPTLPSAGTRRGARAPRRRRAGSGWPR